MELKKETLKWYKGKKVFVTGHTGFKGSWLSTILLNAGADVTGFSLLPECEKNLFDLSGLSSKINSIIGDIRDIEVLNTAYSESSPDIIFHLAAQPLVRDSYSNPLYTYQTNVMGTVNLLECIRNSSNPPLSVVNVTTDKVYLNREWEWGYREDEALDGHDPYSNSKSCSELVTHSYNKSFFHDINLPVSTARAGNVIGGGDFSKDRIIPDCVKSAEKQESLIIRNPDSTRPYQHVLEPLFAYLLIAKKQAEDFQFADYYNVGPDDLDCITTGKLTDLFSEYWGQGFSKKIQQDLNAPHEANFLKLDCSRIKTRLNWSSHWNIYEAVKKTVEWEKSRIFGENPYQLMIRQLEEFLA